MSSPVSDLLSTRREFHDENVPTASSKQQTDVESDIKGVYALHDQRGDVSLNPDFPKLNRTQTIHYLLGELFSDSIQGEVFDCNRAWLCYWILQSLSLLDYELDEVSKSRVVTFLSSLENDSSGGFAGGPGQLSHLAPTYAAVNALCLLGTEEAYRAINRPALVRFLNQLKVGDGSFYMHLGGEIDIRSVYCAISVAKITNTFSEELFKGSAEWILRCQSYEGGFSGSPGMEAHGGYTFCAIAALHILNCLELCDTKSLLRWLTNRQMSFEGGFQGRTNKLVDSCYSFWQTGGLALLNSLLMSNEKESKYLDRSTWLFDSELLQEYILLCCQHKNGGLMDKPGRRRDCYHTCYSLSGLSISQHLPNSRGETCTIGTPGNILEQVHPAYNITSNKIMDAIKYFYSS